MTLTEQQYPLSPLDLVVSETVGNLRIYGSRINYALEFRPMWLRCRERFYVAARATTKERMGEPA